ncbi:MAG: DUF4423 domain-containing protein [Bdellovibrionales bacterium]|nr:DUF4423 domain-containing protein [Bdellovibrionales bacterium]
MMELLYESPNYRVFLRKVLELPPFGRGSRLRLAEELGVQPSLVSQVLSEKLEFTLEQVFGAAKFLGLDTAETRYFLTLHQRDRAASPKLRAYFQNDLDSLLRERGEIRRRVKRSLPALKPEDFYRYYEGYLPAAIHMAIRNPDRQKIESLSEYLRADRTAIRRSLEILVEMGLAKPATGGRFHPNEANLHAPTGTPGLLSHHLNWRNQAIRSLDRPPDGALHYTWVMSADPSAFEHIRDELLKCIQSTDAAVVKAQDSAVYALTLDLFRPFD